MRKKEKGKVFQSLYTAQHLTSINNNYNNNSNKKENYFFSSVANNTTIDTIDMAIMCVCVCIKQTNEL